MLSKNGNGAEKVSAAIQPATRQSEGDCGFDSRTGATAYLHAPVSSDPIMLLMP